ncbi:MAG: hypothetical protein AAFQ79_09440 [Pseudomonadota bacterium]
MTYVVWGGAAVTVAGVLGLLACALLAMRARQAGLDDAALRARLQRVVTLNLASLALSGLGLMAVVVGLFLS